MNTPRAHEPATVARGQTSLRERVQKTLARTRSYQSLDPKRREEVARNMETTLAFLQEAGVADAMLPVARAMQGTGDDFTGGAAREGAAVMKNLVKDVDFPAFVKGLIQGVFRSIVESSVEQMQEFAKFLESVVKSVDQFAREETDPDEARDYVAGKFPNALERKQGSDGASRLAYKPDLDDKDMPDFQSLFGLSEKPDLEDAEGEEKLVHAGRLEMAKQRQQLLATMVLLGINRIVVTDGEIRASVMFDVKSEDTAHADDRRTNTTEDSTREFEAQSESKRSFWGTSGSSKYKSKLHTKVSTDFSSTGSSSDSRLESHAKLTGNVLVKFKSETFPLERMASPMELAGLNQKAQK